MQINDGSKVLIEQLKETVKMLEANLLETKFCIENISNDEQDLNFTQDLSTTLVLKHVFFIGACS